MERIKSLPVLAGLLVALLAPLDAAAAQAASACSPSDSAAGAAIRERLRQWVEQTNRGDRAGAREIWAPGIVGWFPGAPVFADSAAYAAANLPYRAGAGNGVVSYELTVEEVAASGPIAAVHDVWTETRRLPGAAAPVRRVIRGSELWRCQPDGKWRIARFVSAPEPWAPAR